MIKITQINGDNFYINDQLGIALKGTVFNHLDVSPNIIR